MSKLMKVRTQHWPILQVLFVAPSLTVMHAWLSLSVTTVILAICLVLFFMGGIVYIFNMEYPVAHWVWGMPCIMVGIWVPAVIILIASSLSVWDTVICAFLMFFIPVTVATLWGSHI